LQIFADIFQDTGFILSLSLIATQITVH